MVKVKICGLSEPETLRTAVEAGADWIGFAFPEKSPRHVTHETAAALIDDMGASVPVALLLDPTDEEIDAVLALGIRVLQLHGSETPERLAEVKGRTGVEVWKALGVASPVDLAYAETFTAADRLLIDAKPPEGATRTGGHGETFDWSILDGWAAPKPWLLAGGLTPDNAKTAIAATNAPALDVSSGVETAPGVKDAALIKAFIEAAKA